MIVSLQFWFFCLLLFFALHFTPITNQNLWIRLIVYYVISMYCKTRFFFLHVHPSLRCRNQTVIVTGASTGIGAETAKELCHRGAKVIWAARSRKKCEQLISDLEWSTDRGPRGYSLWLDLADLSSIRQFVKEFLERDGKLNCLILNCCAVTRP